MGSWNRFRRVLLTQKRDKKHFLMNFYIFNPTVTKTSCSADGVRGKTPHILKSVKRMTPWGHPVLPSLAKHETFRGLNLPSPPFSGKKCLQQTHCFVLSFSFYANLSLQTCPRYAVCITQTPNVPKRKLHIKLLWAFVLLTSPSFKSTVRAPVKNTGCRGLSAVVCF